MTGTGTIQRLPQYQEPLPWERHQWCEAFIHGRAGVLIVRAVDARAEPDLLEPLSRATCAFNNWLIDNIMQPPSTF